MFYAATRFIFIHFSLGNIVVTLNIKKNTNEKSD